MCVWKSTVVEIFRERERDREEKEKDYFKNMEPEQSDQKSSWNQQISHQWLINIQDLISLTIAVQFQII